MALDYTKPGPELMIDLINVSNGTKFKVADLTLTDIGPHTDPEYPNENTKVTATGTGTTRFKGPKDLFYRRLDIAVTLGGRNITFNVAADVTFEQVLTLMNQRYSLGFGTDDLSWDHTGQVTGTKEVTLTAQAGSLTYFGTTKIILKAA